MISCSHWGLYPIGYTLDGLLDGMSEKNIHPEIPTSAPVNFKKYSWGWYNAIREQAKLFHAYQATQSYDSKLLHG